jgi:hypothetical protein
MSAQFRERHRAYGWRTPHDEIEVAICCGWRFADAPEDMTVPDDGSVIMLPAPASPEGPMHRVILQNYHVGNPRPFWRLRSGRCEK